MPLAGKYRYCFATGKGRRHFLECMSPEVAQCLNHLPLILVEHNDQQYRRLQSNQMLKSRKPQILSTTMVLLSGR
jgi:hypothetical protein